MEKNRVTMKWTICLAVLLTADSLKLENQGASVLSELAISKDPDKKPDPMTNLLTLFFRAGISSATGAGIGALMGGATFAKNDSKLRGAVTGLTGAAVGSVVGDAVVMVGPRVIDYVRTASGVGHSPNAENPVSKNGGKKPGVGTSINKAPQGMGLNNEGKLCEVHASPQTGVSQLLRHELLEETLIDCREVENRCIGTNMFAYFATSSSTNKILEEVDNRIKDLQTQKTLQKKHLSLVQAANIMFITYINAAKVEELLGVTKLPSQDQHPFSFFLDGKTTGDLACIYFLGSIHSLIDFDDKKTKPDGTPRAPSETKRPIIKQQLDAGIRFFDVRLFSDSLRGYDPTSAIQKWGSYTWANFWGQLEQWCLLTYRSSKKRTPIFIRVEPKTKSAEKEFIKQLLGTINYNKVPENTLTWDEVRSRTGEGIGPKTSVSQLMTRSNGLWVGACRIVMFGSNWYDEKKPTDYWTLVSGYPTPAVEVSSEVPTQNVLDAQQKSLDFLTKPLKKECPASHEMFAKKFMRLDADTYKARLDKRKYSLRKTRSTEFW